MGVSLEHVHESPNVPEPGRLLKRIATERANGKRLPNRNIEQRRNHSDHRQRYCANFDHGEQRSAFATLVRWAIRNDP